jgi:hypothetical protein
MADLLPTSYYHVVFTLPHELNPLIMHQRTALFKLLFQASAHTLLTLGKDQQHLGAEIGITSILHTCLPAVQDFGRRGDKTFPFIPMSTALSVVGVCVMQYGFQKNGSGITSCFPRQPCKKSLKDFSCITCVCFLKSS